MPAQCAITGKTYMRVIKRSKSMQSTITRVKPNLQRVRIGNKKVKISVRALRTLEKFAKKAQG
jgi:ribosomal protein L28